MARKQHAGPSEPPIPEPESDEPLVADLRRSFEISRARASSDVGGRVGGKRVSVVGRTFARRDVAEHALVETQGDQYKAATICMDLWGIGRRQANDYVAGAIDRWEQESASLTREQKRALLRIRIRRIERAALEHEKPMVVGDGGGLAHVERHREAQVKTALDALMLEAKLDGLFEAEKLDVTVGGTVETRVMAVIAKAYGLESAAVVEGEAEPVQLPAGEESEP